MQKTTTKCQKMPKILWNPIQNVFLWCLFGFASSWALQDAPTWPQDQPRWPFLCQIAIFQKTQKNLRKINGFGSPSRPKIAPRSPQSRSRSPKIDPRRLQDGPKTVLEGIFVALEHRLRFWVILGSILAPFWLPKCAQRAPQMPPFWHPFGAQNQSKNRSEIGMP